MKECIVLAGGLGTRLQSVVSDRPKCMALVAGKPFLQYMLDYFEKEGFDHVVLSLGYKSELVLSWVSSLNYSFEIKCVVEDKPLGTGGAIKFASKHTSDSQIFIFNGDSFFNIDTNLFIKFHQRNASNLTIALKPMFNFDRYGCVELSENNRVLKFKEKQFQRQGLINAGVYLLNKSILDDARLPDQFSFEKDILENKLSKLAFYGYVQDEYFIDIGIPSDFEKANIYFSQYDKN